MRNVWVVGKREYLERVRTKAFLISTILLPLFMAAMMILPGKLASMKTGRVKKITVVASTPEFGRYVEKQLEERASDAGTKFQVETSTDASPEAIARLRAAVNGGQVDGYLLATQDLLDKGKASYVAKDTSDFVESAVLAGSVSMAQTQQRLAARGLKDADMKQLFAKVDLDTVRLEAGKESKASGVVMLLTSITMMMMVYMTVVLYGIAVMRSVLEEKNSRVIEVMLASVTPKEMMAGKVLGVGAVGITQIAIWWFLAAVVTRPLMASSPGAMGGIQVSDLKLGYFLIFFLLGYFLYASLWAALGAMVNSEQEAQQLQFFVMLPLIFSTVVMVMVIRQPSSALAMWMSFVPFCTPLIMYLRVVVQQPPMWQIGVSIAITVATIYGLLLLCSRIYRVGILMYGKRPTLPEIVKWIRYA